MQSQLLTNLSKKILENCGKRRKIPETSIFFFSHNDFSLYQHVNCCLQMLSIRFCLELCDIWYVMKGTEAAKSKCRQFSPLSDVKILLLSKLEAFADDELNVAKIVQIFCDTRGRKHGENRRKCWSQYFLLFSQCFHRAFSSVLFKPVNVW